MYIGSCIFFACALAVVFADNEGEEIQNAVDSCLVQHGFSVDEYENFVLYDLNYELDNCVMACTMKKLGTLSEDGVFTGERVKELVVKSGSSQEDIKNFYAIVDQCATKYGKGGEDSCETVKNLRSCYKVAIPGPWQNELTINGSVNQILLLTPENSP